ncbi:hypothetical protein ABWH88_04300 [Marinobacter adhaerens]|jgi:hypothetical protein|uniref:hypothetical protein n=1 Tax=Marinobacter TaxID=2742 RepID=UPI001C5E9578|nr:MULTISPECIES: hypothetical protein [Marinobacter]MBW4979718.1 hypothetical protein [Marinobacter adhaerens]MBY6073126.1 hypothetical protein [Marinobacter salsuginis]MDC8456057.1 hypothetical protein [Marinobacter sp. DS40M6]
MAHSNAPNNDVSEVMIRLGISETDLSKLLKVADIDYPVHASPERSTDTHPLSEKEVEVLRSGGAKGLDAGPNLHIARVNSLRRLIEECQTLIEHALYSESVAKLLQISVAEVERNAQRSPPYLHGFELEPGVWRFPAWQFTDAGEIPHLATILPILAHREPMFLDRFMRLPHCDLEIDHKPVSPRDWLIAKHDPDQIFQLVRLLESD